MGFKLQTEIDYEAIPTDKGLIMTNSSVLSESLSVMVTWNSMILCKPFSLNREKHTGY